MHLLIDFVIILLLIVGVSQFRTPVGARRGNLLAAFALLCSLVVILYRNPVLKPDISLIAIILVFGSLVGWYIASRVSMIRIPAMVAFQHGAGGVAVFLVSFVELTRDASLLNSISEISGIVGLVIGAATFSGSMIASAKLANWMKQTPTVFPKHSLILTGIVILAVALSIVAAVTSGQATLQALILLVFVSIVLGIVFSIRIGGADMPVLISFLNATAGLAAAFCGVIIQNRLLIACGATVASSGSILTHVMCKSMNRSLFNVFVGIKSYPAEARTVTAEEDSIDGIPGLESPTADKEPKKHEDKDPLSQALEAAKQAAKIIIVPGYGMALAQAQTETTKLADKLEAMGKEVKFAIHPVAGRMPGHVHVLLAEADADYDKLFEMDDINPEFGETNLVFIIGACDVVNTAAIESEGTTISGMPILTVHEAERIVVCNLDEKPGYSGVENPLYENPKSILLFGDAKETLNKLLQGLN